VKPKFTDVLGYEGMYFIYDTGVVQSYARPSKNGVRSFPSKVMSPFNNGTGYYQVNLTNANKVRSKHYVHGLVWEAFNGKIPEGLEIDHIDNDKNNNNLSNLRLVTRRDNMKKMLENNPHVRYNLLHCE